MCTAPLLTQIIMTSLMLQMSADTRWQDSMMQTMQRSAWARPICAIIVLSSAALFIWAQLTVSWRLQHGGIHRTRQRLASWHDIRGPFILRRDLGAPASLMANSSSAYNASEALLQGVCSALCASCLCMMHALPTSRKLDVSIRGMTERGPEIFPCE